MNKKQQKQAPFMPSEWYFAMCATRDIDTNLCPYNLELKVDDKRPFENFYPVSIEQETWTGHRVVSWGVIYRSWQSGIVHKKLALGCLVGHHRGGYYDTVGESE